MWQHFRSSIFVVAASAACRFAHSLAQYSIEWW
jgi:hypothetical protein